MNLQKVKITIPEEMIPFVLAVDNEMQLRQNAMLLYPYIQDGMISHGKAAEILGIHKLDLIILYGKLGMVYFQESDEELDEDIRTIRNIRKSAV